jgi:hypothetical protein
MNLSVLHPVLPRYHSASSLLVLRDGSGILMAESTGHRIRLYDTTTGTAFIIAGNASLDNEDGPALEASIRWPECMAFDASSAVPESTVYITTSTKLRRLSLQIGTDPPLVSRARLHMMPSDDSCRNTLQGWKGCWCRAAR